ncbi:MAG: 3-dehydroquinate synthase [bacterium]
MQIDKKKSKIPASNHKKIMVKLAKRSYPIYIEPGLLTQIHRYIKKLSIGKQIALITNPTVGNLYAETVKSELCQAGLQPVIFAIPDGEWYKNLDVVRDLYSRLLEQGFDRNSAIVALGGGVIGDLAGFVAATYLRGIPFIQIPTTLLAQVDSSVGGKVGVNLLEGKNLVGSFYQPILVLIDPTVLTTLPERELKSGLAEVIKHGVIYDTAFFGWLEKNIPQILDLDLQCLTTIIARSCEIKAEVVSLDEIEHGLRAILNFGHTIGHAIETLTGYERYRHGEAVAIGMVAAGKLAQSITRFNPQESIRLINLINATGLPTAIPNLAISKFLDTIYRDKKITNHMLRMVLPQKLGQVKIINDISEKQIIQTIRALTAK